MFVHLDGAWREAATDVLLRLEGLDFLRVECGRYGIGDLWVGAAVSG